jgi:hypothetical protein
MSRFLGRAMLSLAAALACQAGVAVAQHISPTSATDTSRAAGAAGEPKAAAPAVAPYLVDGPTCIDAGCSACPACEDCLGAAAEATCAAWTFDYRVRSMFCSRTTYEFGTSPQDPPPQYAPLSRLNWPLDSTWHGLQVGLEKPSFRAHFEWMAPMVQTMYGDMADYDWSGPDRDPASLSVSPQRWNDAQTLELEGAVKLTERFFCLPIELWPVLGFRFQRFSMTAYDGLQVINDGTMPGLPPVGYRWTEDTISFNQQYYMGYVGGQLCTTLKFARFNPITLTFQGDWAATSGYNVDHHISGYEPDTHRYTKESTHGGAMHLALIAEVRISRCFNVGLQADHTEIRTTGTHHWLMSGAENADETWGNGVSVESDQTSLTVFLRGRF